MRTLPEYQDKGPGETEHSAQWLLAVDAPAGAEALITKVRGKRSQGTFLPNPRDSEQSVLRTLCVWRGMVTVPRRHFRNMV